MLENATLVIGRALAGTGIELVASAPIAAYDERAPGPFQSAVLLRGARGVVVAGSAGPALWRAFRARTIEEPARWKAEHPYDVFVAEQLDRVDLALRAARIRFVRFEAAFHAPVRVDFVELARLVKLGEPGPFSLLIHPTYGPWWGLRGAWLVDADVDPARDFTPPCLGCSAPCVAGQPREGATGVARATPQVRARCVVGPVWRYDEDQIAYHYDREVTRLRLTGVADR